MKKKAPRNMARTLFDRESDGELLNIGDQIITIITVDIQRDGLGKIQREDTQNGLGVYHMAASAQVHVIRITVNNIDKRLDVFCQAELDVDRLHEYSPPLVMVHAIIHQAGLKINTAG